MLQVEMVASVRKDFGKGAMRSLRREGRTPAVLYGPQIDPMALSLETREFSKVLLNLHGENAVVTLDVKDGKKKKKRHVVLKEVQADPVMDTVIHADFLEISLDEPVSLPVTLKFAGTPKGVDMGGVLQVSMYKVILKGLPLDLPDFIEVDISALELGGQGVSCKDLSLPGNVTLIDDEERTCVAVAHPSRASEEEEELEAETEEEETAEATTEESPAEEKTEE